MSKVIARVIDDDTFVKSMTVFENNPMVVRYTLTTGWALQQVNEYETDVKPLTGDYLQQICPVQLEVEQVQGLPKRIYLWAVLPALMGPKHTSVDAPYGVELRTSPVGKQVPTFRRFVNPLVSMTAQLKEFAQEMHMFYLTNCENNLYERK
jgi:hypothetical protein